MDTEMWF